MNVKWYENSYDYWMSQYGMVHEGRSGPEELK